MFINNKNVRFLSTLVFFVLKWCFWQGAELDRERQKRQRERSNNLKEGERDMKVIKRQSDALQEVISQRDALAEELASTKNEGDLENRSLKRS